ncbi:flavin reductase family protein [Bradyrhizobium sp. sBnM-33]|uniref:flavin reductase family protein n=1 Tax=Bradyrhizobium sp. sBnM-33 TaxID=2831780 RepID=UPI001BD10588|nr:flavin reductase family protein [Bradyrhizobium sp. sBnM-33]WOH48393.1 flavin reductase family protein [Bradyrhizobium sp. sBnM-33]
MSLDSASDELRETFKRALRRFPAAVSVITSADQNRRHGMTATAVTSLSLDPPSLIVCVNQQTLLHDIMLLARRFCVNVLRRDQITLSSAFSGGVPAEERFELGQWMTSAEGVTYLADAQINIFCKKAAAVPYGTHTIFIGEAETVNMRDPIEPLIYQDATYCFSVPHDSQAA